MQFWLDTEKQVLEIREEQGSKTLPLYSNEGLEFLSKAWIKVQWNQRHWQSHSWMGLPIWQLPEDLIRLQEIIFDLAPSVIVETGINRGGSAVFFASFCQVLGKGKVVSIDISIPENVRKSIENHPLGNYITLIEGDSVAPEAIEAVKREVRDGDVVLVFLDSDHSKAHVTGELEAYGPLVSKGSYIVACDGVMEILGDTPFGKPEWKEDNPAAAAREFVARNRSFMIERPTSKFGNELIIENLTYWPDAWLKRVC